MSSEYKKTIITITAAEIKRAIAECDVQWKKPAVVCGCAIHHQKPKTYNAVRWVKQPLMEIEEKTSAFLINENPSVGNQSKDYVTSLPKLPWVRNRLPRLMSYCEVGYDKTKKDFVIYDQFVYLDINRVD